jgi:hypothetical protein
MSTRNLSGGKQRPVHKADNLNTICVLSLNLSQPYGTTQTVNKDSFTFFTGKTLENVNSEVEIKITDLRDMM